MQGKCPEMSFNSAGNLMLKLYCTPILNLKRRLMLNYIKDCDQNVIIVLFSHDQKCIIQMAVMILLNLRQRIYPFTHLFFLCNECRAYVPRSFALLEAQIREHMMASCNLHSVSHIVTAKNALLLANELTGDGEKVLLYVMDQRHNLVGKFFFLL